MSNEYEYEIDLEDDDSPVSVEKIPVKIKPSQAMLIYNAMNTIEIYWYAKTWVFDDVSRGLDKEPFVAGVPEMIDLMIKKVYKKVDRKKKYQVLFSESPFPGFMVEITKGKNELGGAFYKGTYPEVISGQVGWLCPATLKFFPKFPNKIFIKIK